MENISRLDFRFARSFRKSPAPSPSSLSVSNHRPATRGNKDSFVGENFSRGIGCGLRSRLIAAANSPRAINSNLCTSYPIHRESRPFAALYRGKRRAATWPERERGEREEKRKIEIAVQFRSTAIRCLVQLNRPDPSTKCAELLTELITFRRKRNGG